MPDERNERNDVFVFQVALSVLDHLSEGLYSNVAAVITEAVANAWDADAKTVRIDVLDATGRRVDDLADAEQVVVHDDGIGMSADDVRHRYLHLGYRRRNESDETPSGRKVMGRKGLGKLSLVTIADRIVVETLKKGEEPLAFELDAASLRKKAAEGEAIADFPVPRVAVQDPRALQPHGTRIVLHGLRKKRLRAARAEQIRAWIAKRFSVVFDDDFTVFVNDAPVTQADRKDLQNVEYVWTFGDVEPPLPPGTKPSKTVKLPERADDWPLEWHVRGWVATGAKPFKGPANAVVVMARGRLAAENVLAELQGGQNFYRYVTGQVEADFLDATNQDDVITTDRQRLKAEDERVAKLHSFLRSHLPNMEEEWKKWRAQARKKELFERFPKLSDWLEDLPQGARKKAETLLEKVASLENDLGEPLADRSLLRATVFGFERLRLRGEPEKLAEALEEGVDAMLRLLAAHDDLEVALYRDIVRERLKALKAMQGHLDEDALEKVLQEYLFEHLWLLDPAWDRATADTHMEERLKLQDPFKNDDETKEKFGRVDIRYRRVGGSGVLVELKRNSVKASPGELFDQCLKYHKALEAITKDRFAIVVIVGKKIDEESRKQTENSLNTIAPGSKVLTYDQLLAQASQAYAEFMEKSRKIDKLEALFEKDEETDDDA